MDRIDEIRAELESLKVELAELEPDEFMERAQIRARRQELIAESTRLRTGQLETA